MEAAFICTEELWSRGFGEDHPLKPERLKHTYELLTAYRAFGAPTRARCRRALSGGCTTRGPRWHPVSVSSAM